MILCADCFDEKSTKSCDGKDGKSGLVKVRLGQSQGIVFVLVAELSCGDKKEIPNGEGLKKTLN